MRDGQLAELSRLRRSLLRGQPQTSDRGREEIRVYEYVYEYVGGPVLA